MGMMFQVSGLFTDLSVYDNLAFPMREHTDLPEEMIRDLVLMKLHAVGLRNAHKLMPSELSGGMERRVALARATATDPALIIYDEPFAGPRPDFAQHHREPDPPAERRARRDFGCGHLRSVRIAESRRLCVFHPRRQSRGGRRRSGEIFASEDPFVRQFLHAQPDGPVAFQYPSRPYTEDLEIKVAAN